VKRPADFSRNPLPPSQETYPGVLAVDFLRRTESMHWTRRITALPLTRLLPPFVVRLAEDE